MDKRRFSIILIVGLVLITAMACNAISGITERAEKAKQDAQALATQASKGAKAISTLEAGLTAVAGSKVVETSRALVATVVESGPAQTAQAMVTEQGPGLLHTAMAAATEDIPGLVETARAYITEEGPGAIETAQALETRIAGGTGKIPADIPIVSGPTKNFYATDSLLMYLTDQPFAQVLAFYKGSMPTEGWVIDSEKSIETEKSAILHYTQGERTATVTLNFDPVSQGTIVLITVSKP